MWSCLGDNGDSDDNGDNNLAAVPSSASSGKDDKRRSAHFHQERRADVASRLSSRLTGVNCRVGFAMDAKHFDHCSATGCARCMFIMHEERWVEELVLAPGIEAPASWVDTATSSDGQWGVGCICCRDAGMVGNLAKFELRTAKALQKCHLQDHQALSSHKNAVEEYLGKRGLTSSGVSLAAAPHLSSFEKLWNQTCDGIAPSSSALADLGGYHKLQQMLFCVAEAIREDDRTFLAGARCVALFRDERHARIAVRYVACNADMEVRHGHLGSKRHPGTGVAAITKATRDLMVILATPGIGAPLGGGTRQREPKVEVKMDAVLFARISSNIRMVAVDAAADEVASVRDMQEPAGGGPALAPNLEALLRDKAHGARRTMSRPWKADGHLHEIITFYVTSKTSMVQKIDHSPELRRVFDQHCRSINGRIVRKSKTMLWLHSAKHRFESIAAPMARLVLWMPAFIMTAREVLLLRTMAAAEYCALFLEHITTKTCVLVAMMADAADDGLTFIRKADDFDSADAAEINADVYCFLIRIVELYRNGKITATTTSFTTYMLDLLKASPVTVQMQNGQMKTIGDASGVSQARPQLSQRPSRLPLAAAAAALRRSSSEPARISSMSACGTCPDGSSSASKS
jgi:hypothetical protein